MNTYYVYLHRNPTTNKIFYVGKGTGNRVNTKSNRGKFYINYVKKHGNPIVEIIEKDLSNEQAIELEKYYIKYYGRRDLNTGILVNCTDGGEGCEGLKHSEDTKKKMSENRKGIPSFRKGILNPYSKETLEKMSKSSANVKRGKYKERKDKGKTFSLEARIRMSNGHIYPILQYNKNENFMAEWKTTTYAEKILNINGIRNVLDVKGRSAGGFIWKRKTYKKMNKQEIKTIIKPENGIEEAIIADAEFIKGCNYGKSRPGHPEGQIILHIKEVLENIDKFYADDNDRENLRFIAIIHDTFKYKVDKNKHKSGENHHAMIARRFAEKFIRDIKTHIIIELHDEAYNAWSMGGRRGNWYKAERRANQLIQGLLIEGCLDLYVKFFHCDNKTGDKEQENYEWFINLIK